MRESFNRELPEVEKHVALHLGFHCDFLFLLYRNEMPSALSSTKRRFRILTPERLIGLGRIAAAFESFGKTILEVLLVVFAPAVAFVDIETEGIKTGIA